MNVVFFSHYYSPEGNAPASRTAEHCSHWVKEGEELNVTVITCAPNVPDGEVYKGYRNRLWPQRERIDGVDVVRVWTFLRPKPSRTQLILNYISFLVTSLATFVFFVRRPDVIVATTPQFFCGITGILASWLKWRPVVLEVRDIWPESIVAVGALKRGLAIGLLERLERWMYRSASHIVTVGPGYRDNILSKVDVGDKISMVTNGVSVNRFTPLKKCPEFAKRHELTGKFVCSYVGTVGRAHGLKVLVRAAEHLKQQQRSDIVFLVVGGGAKLDELRQTVSNGQLGALIRFTGRLEKEEMPIAIAASDACLVHLSKADLFEHVIPSKIFETMAMERAIIMGVQGVALEIVKQGQCGVTMEPENDLELIDILDSMRSAPEAVLEMGREGRKFVTQYFNRDQLAIDMLEVLRKTANREKFQLDDRDWTGVPSAVTPRIDMDTVTATGNSVQ